MRFEPLDVPGAFVIHPEAHHDERGSFARTFCADEFVAHGLNPNVRQCSISHNTRRGTLRGMHYQIDPAGEDKLVRCTRGALFDVVVDLRRESPQFQRWTGVTLAAADGAAVYIPRGCAHGFLTLERDTEVHYQVSAPYAPVLARGVRWDDPAFGIQWPSAPVVISARDAQWPYR